MNMHPDTEREFKDWYNKTYPSCWKAHAVIEKINTHFVDKKEMAQKFWGFENALHKYKCGGHRKLIKEIQDLRAALLNKEKAKEEDKKERSA